MDLPTEVKLFIGLMAIGAGATGLFFIIKKNQIHLEARDIFLRLLGIALGRFFPSLTQYVDDKPSRSTGATARSKVKRTVQHASSDKEVIDLLVSRKVRVDVSAERSGQRSLAGVALIKRMNGLVLECDLAELVSEKLLLPGSTVKCIFTEMAYGERRINAFVGKVLQLSQDRRISIQRTSGFGFIRRRAFARRKVADQRYIKVKVWKIDPEDYDIDTCLDDIEPDITIDNRRTATPKATAEQVLDISKGGMALRAAVRLGGNMMSVNDRVLLAMLMYTPKRKVFIPHLILAEVRGARSAGNGQVRLSFQFMRSLKVPPRKRSSLFKGQALMASALEHPEG